MSVHDYWVFGLKVRSELRLPELFEDEAHSLPDVTIKLGTVDSSSEAGLHVDGEALVLVVPRIARFRIADGQSIVIEPEKGAAERNVRLFLLGSAFGALLHQRGLLPLHANAIEIEGRAVAFMGESGAGKSTLAAWMHDRGYRIVADDVCVVRFDRRGRPRSTPGLPRLRLGLEVLNAFGRDASAYDRSYVGDGPSEKYDVPVAREASAQGDLEFAAVYLLGKAQELKIDRLDGVEATEAVFANTYRGGFLAAGTGQQTHWEASVKLVQTTPIYRLERPWELDRMDTDCTRILEHVEREVLAATETGQDE